jgi:hypothetical protein
LAALSILKDTTRQASRDAAALVQPSRLITIGFNDEARRQLTSGGQVFGTA